MRYLSVLIAYLSLSLCAGCATEREYFFNHNPITDTTIFVGEVVGGFFEKPNSDLSDVRYSAKERAEIRYLDRR